MSALWRESAPAGGRRLRPLGVDDLDAVLAIERVCYGFPWTRGNFLDSIAAGYLLEGVFVDADLLGYMVAMAGVEEMHLLNLTVAPAARGHGHARALLDALVERCIECGARTLWLEVRTSNLRARSIYRRYGFTEVGMRRSYYPAPRNRREDALVMSLAIAAKGGDGVV
ncbi:MAG: ribosomal protein S18-alanine N-acetyltransferase [Betaproteobacteria bacterium]